MTRLVSLFFVAIALMLAAYWVVPGAKPPEMAAVTPPPAPVASGPVKLQAAPPAPLQQAVAPAAPPVEAAAPRVVKTAENGCDADPIKCMLDGRSARPDPTEMTGTIIPRKPAPKPAPLAAPKPPVRPHP
jgi:hypothetical protein